MSYLYFDAHTCFSAVPQLTTRNDLTNVEETIRSVEPFEADFTFTVDGDSITLTVGKDLSVIDVTRSQPDISD